jgi:small subunit ribosomal protein S9
MVKKKTTKKAKYYYGIGRRKTAVATVRLYKGKGEDLINGKKVKDIYKIPTRLRKLYHPFGITDTKDKFHFTVHVKGGGESAQIDAIVLGISRTLIMFDETFRKSLKIAKLLRRDSRKKERKKPGFRKARKKEQYSKR